MMSWDVAMNRKECHDCGSPRVGRYGDCENCAEAAKLRGYEQRKQQEAWLRRQGYDEEYIKTH